MKPCIVSVRSRPSLWRTIYRHKIHSRCLEISKRYWIPSAAATYAASPPSINSDVIVLLLLSPGGWYDVVVPAWTGPLFVRNFRLFSFTTSSAHSHPHTFKKPNYPALQPHLLTQYTQHNDTSQLRHNVTSTLYHRAISKRRLGHHVPSTRTYPTTVLVPVRRSASSVRRAVWRAHRQDAEEQKLGLV
jgi:hypothetical protein